MADNFGLKIGLEGEKQFKDALREINQSFKVLGSEMTLVSSQFDKNDKSVQAITARNAVLNKEIDAQREKIATLKAALDNAAASFGENDRRTQNWQIQLNKAQAELNGMEGELAENEKSLRDVNRGYNDAGQKVDEFGNVVEESVDDVEESSNKLEKLGSALKGIGVAMGAAFAAIGTAAVGAAKALTDMTVGASQYADDILTMSTVTGMSTESLQAYKYAAELVDTSMETLTGSMARNIRSMNSAREGTGAASQAYKALGISITDANGNLRDSETVYWETIDALGNVANETERDALAMQLFGKSAQELNPLIAQGSEGINQLTEEAKAMGAVMSQESLEALGKFDDSMQRLKSGGEAAKNALGMVLLPQLQVLADDGVSLLGEFTRGLNEANGDWTKISEVIGNTVGGIVNMLLEQLPDIIELALSIVTSIGSAIIDNLPVIVDAASQIINTLLQALVGALPGITEGALQLVLALVDGIIANLPAIVEAAVQMIATLVTGIANALPELIPAAVSAVTQIVTALIESLPLLLDAALQLMLGLAQGIVEAIPVLIESLPAVIDALIGFVTGAIPQIVAVIPEIVQALVTVITENIPQIVQAGVALFVSLVQEPPSIITQILEAVPQIIDGIVGAVLDALPQIVQAGIELLTSLVDALPEIIDAIVEAIPEIIDSILAAVFEAIPLIVEAGIKLLVALIQNLPRIITTVVAAIPKIITSLVSAILGNIDKIILAGVQLLVALVANLPTIIVEVVKAIPAFIVVSKRIYSPVSIFKSSGFVTVPSARNTISHPQATSPILFTVMIWLGWRIPNSMPVSGISSANSNIGIHDASSCRTSSGVSKNGDGQSKLTKKFGILCRVDTVNPASSTMQAICRSL
jgi:phage-related protein